MQIQRLRLKRGWSQQQLAQASGLSVRTVQRIESGAPASTETLKSLAAVFEVDFSTLQQDEQMNPTEKNLEALKEEEAFRYVSQLRRFYKRLIVFVPVAIFLLALNLWKSPHHLWSLWVIGFWSLGIAIRAVRLFGVSRIFSSEWELKQVEKRLGRPL